MRSIMWILPNNFHRCRQVQSMITVNYYNPTGNCTKQLQIHYVECGHRASDRSLPADQFSDRIRIGPTCCATAQRWRSRQEQGAQLKERGLQLLTRGVQPVNCGTILASLQTSTHHVTLQIPHLWLNSIFKINHILITTFNCNIYTVDQKNVTPFSSAIIPLNPD